MCAVLRTLRYEKHPWQFSLNHRLHSFLNLKMKQTETQKKKLISIVCLQAAVSSHPKRIRGIIPVLRSFPTDCPSKGGGGGQCQKFVTSQVCLLRSAELEHENLLRDRACDVFDVPDISKIQQIIN